MERVVIKMKIKMVRDTIKKYKLPATRVALLWLENYEVCPSFKDSYYFAKYESLNTFIDNFVKDHPKVEDENGLRFQLILNPIETEVLKMYLLKNKNFFINYLKKMGRFKGNHLYQLYLQYLSYELNEVEKTLFLDGYFRMLEDLYRKDYTLLRKKVEKRLHLTD